VSMAEPCGLWEMPGSPRKECGEFPVKAIGTKPGAREQSD